MADRGLATFSPDREPSTAVSAYLACVVRLPFFFVEEWRRSKRSR